MKVLYSTSAIVTGGREGHGKTADGKLDLKLSKPKELDGSGGEGVNPEQLFAIGYAACFESAIALVAQQKKKEIGEVTINSEVHLGLTNEGALQLAVDFKVNVPGISKEEAETIVNEAKGVCPYARATKGNVETNTTIV